MYEEIDRIAARNGDDVDRGTGTETDGEREHHTEIWLETGELVVYDTDSPDAWVQSGSAVALGAMA